jgi:hypothetical protein
VGRERPEPRLGHAQRCPDVLVGGVVESGCGEALDEEAEDERGPVGVLDGFARRPVQLLVDDAAADGCGVSAVQRSEVGAQRDPGGVGEQLVDGDVAERVTVQLGEKRGEWVVQGERAVLPEHAYQRPHGHDLGEAGHVEDSVSGHRS